MLVAGVHVRLGPDAHDSVKMVNVDVDKYPVKTCQDFLALGLERFGERYVCCDWKQLKIINIMNKLSKNYI